MAKVISGYAESGGSVKFRGSLITRASEDLEAKLNGAVVQAVAVHSDGTGLHLIAVCEGKAEPKPTSPAGNKKGGK